MQRIVEPLPGVEADASFCRRGEVDVAVRSHVQVIHIIERFVRVRGHVREHLQAPGRHVAAEEALERASHVQVRVLDGVEAERPPGSYVPALGRGRRPARRRPDPAVLVHGQ